MRYTKAEVRGMFNRLCKAMGVRGDGCAGIGYVLDYAPIYGGYVIEELCSEGGISHPFSSIRRSAREMYLSMLMTAQALEEIKHKQNMEINSG